MPGWIVSVGLAAIVALVLFVFGSTEVVTILAILFAWFAVLALVALGFEVLTHAIGRRFRRS